MAVNLGATAASQFQEGLRVSQSVTNDVLARLFLDAANDVGDMIAELMSSPRFGARTRAAQLKQVQANLKTISTQLWGTTDESIRQGIFHAADMAATQHLDLDAMMGMPVKGVAGYAENMYILSGRSAEAVIARKNFGYTLSQRVTTNNSATISRISGIVDRGLAQGLGAKELAARVRGFISPDVPGGASYAANRLARTEIQNGYHDARVQQMKGRPWIEKVQWNLSGSHPRSDQCDSIKQDGPYEPKDVPRKPHPQCFCFVTPVLPEPDDFVRRLRRGDYDDWMDGQGVAC